MATDQTERHSDISVAIRVMRGLFAGKTYFAAGTNTGAAGMSSSLAPVAGNFGPLAALVTGGTG